MKFIYEIPDNGTADLWIRAEGYDRLHLSVGDGCGGGYAIWVSPEQALDLAQSLVEWCKKVAAHRNDMMRASVGQGKTRAAEEMRKEKGEGHR